MKIKKTAFRWEKAPANNRTIGWKSGNFENMRNKFLLRMQTSDNTIFYRKILRSNKSDMVLVRPLYHVWIIVVKPFMRCALCLFFFFFQATFSKENQHGFESKERLEKENSSKAEKNLRATTFRFRRGIYWKNWYLKMTEYQQKVQDGFYL